MQSPTYAGDATTPTIEAERNLILVRQPGWQAMDDWHAIARHVREIEPRIEVFVVDADLPNAYTRRAAARRPTLVVSPGLLGSFRPRRGRICHGRQIAKIEQFRLLANAGVPTPKTALLTPSLTMDPAEWGEFVILKPSDLRTASYGSGIQLMRTRRVRYIPAAEYPQGHPARLGPMIVQQFIDSGDIPGITRVLTLFGEPLYAHVIRAAHYAVDRSANDDKIERAVVATQAYEDAERVFVAEEDVLAIARSAHRAVPDVPLKGVDVIRDAASGKLYVLEMNTGANVWHFSSEHLAAKRATLGPEWVRTMHTQFDAFRTAARVLVERTLADAE